MHPGFSERREKQEKTALTTTLTTTGF